MTEQFTNFANVRVEDIPAGLSYCARDGWGAAYRSPEKIKSVNGVMEYHYILEWTMHTPKSRVLIREEYFGSEVIYSSYEFSQQQIEKVGYSGGDCYYIEKDQVRKETPQPAEQLNQGTEKAATIDEKLDEIIDRLDVLEVKFFGEYKADTLGVEADNAGKPIQYFGAVPDEDTESDAIWFYRIEESGIVRKRGDWRVSDQPIKVVKDENGFVVQKLPPNTEYRIIRHPIDTGHWIDHGVLSIRYPN